MKNFDLNSFMSAELLKSAKGGKKEKFPEYEKVFKTNDDKEETKKMTKEEMKEIAVSMNNAWARF